MDDTHNDSLKFRAAKPEQAEILAPLIYNSSHELLDFLFGGKEQAIRGLAKLIARAQGHFSYRFAHVLMRNADIVGVELGYDQAQLAAQELPGALYMPLAMPLTRWPHLMVTANRALSNYVPPPSANAYYINNIAISESERGGGLGRQFLDQVVARAKSRGYTSIELDVTAINEGAIRFYQRYGFVLCGTSGSAALMGQHGLPILNRMHLSIAAQRGFCVDGYGNQTSSTVVNDVTGLNPVRVDDVYAPGSVDQLRWMLRNSDKPVSIGGGRYSMGGQTASPGTLHIDLRGLSEIIEINPQEKTAKVQAGVRWRDLQAAIAPYGLAIKVMQTYADFTIGGSISVNCHGRYVGLGPLILSIRKITLVMHDGEVIDASPVDNSDIFYAAVGGYGALGIVVEAELELADNVAIERITKKQSIEDYPAYFSRWVRDNSDAIFHNSDLIPPHFKKLRAITWRRTDKPVNSRKRREPRRLYLAEKYMLWAITETNSGHFRREYIYEPLIYLRSKVTDRNDEANYHVAELEPLSRNKNTYVLQEYFVPPAQLQAFVAAMAKILSRFDVQVVNVSIRHALADPGSLLAWAREEAFALVLYHKQGTTRCDRERVGVWTRELIDAAIACAGSYYLPYQPHARVDQFNRCYPRANELFALKDKLDPNYRFRNCLWQKYYRTTTEARLFGETETVGSEFLTVYASTESRDAFYRFLQTIYHLYPEHKFHNLIIDACEAHNDDESIYEEVSQRLAEIKPFLSELTYALPALGRQKSEMTQQTVAVLPAGTTVNGYLEIGSTGRYVKKLSKQLNISRPVYLCNDRAPDNSPPEIMERGGIGQVGEYFDFADYEPLPSSQIADNSLDLVTCFIGLHHCPRDRLGAFIKSIHRVLRPGGHFILRDHDAGSDAMRTFCSLVHTVFNAGLGVPWQEDRRELRLFEGVDFWVSAVTSEGFIDTGSRVLQDYDPSLNTLMCFSRDE